MSSKESSREFLLPAEFRGLGASAATPAKKLVPSAAELQARRKELAHVGPRPAAHCNDPAREGGTNVLVRNLETVYRDLCGTFPHCFPAVTLWDEVKVVEKQARKSIPTGVRTQGSARSHGREPQRNGCFFVHREDLLGSMRR